MSSVLSYEISIVTHIVYFLFRIYHPTLCLVIILMLTPVSGQVDVSIILYIICLCDEAVWLMLIMSLLPPNKLYSGVEDILFIKLNVLQSICFNY